MGSDLFQDFQAVLLAEPQIEKDQARMRLFEVAASVSSRKDLSRHLEKAHPSLILLDLRLGQEDGLEVLKEIRSHSHVPIIIMTGHSREEVDRIVGLELGADDYLAKPFGLREIVARGRAVFRRHERGPALPAPNL